MSRSYFRETCVDREGGECIVPWCDSSVTVEPDGPGEVHHILERELWADGGYIPSNGACVCNDHHRMAEENEIPPQAFWRWAELDASSVELPNGIDTIAVDKWGEEWETPPHDDLRDYPKYPSSRHLLPLYWQSERGTQEERTGRDDTGLSSVESFMGIPLVATLKMDGSNAMLVADADEPVRARNGRDATHESFDQLKQAYWDRGVYDNLPDHLQVFGENMYAKHSIHYGCEGCCEERNQGPPVSDIFLVFGVYDTRYNLWLSWWETEQVAEDIGFPTVPVVDKTSIGVDEDMIGSVANGDQLFKTKYTTIGEDVVDQGHEGIIVRSAYPFHYDQFGRKLGKYVRPNHVQTDEHWSHQETVRNDISDL